MPHVTSADQLAIVIRTVSRSFSFTRRGEVQPNNLAANPNGRPFAQEKVAIIFRYLAQYPPLDGATPMNQSSISRVRNQTEATESSTQWLRLLHSFFIDPPENLMIVKEVYLSELTLAGISEDLSVTNSDSFMHFRAANNLAAPTNGNSKLQTQIQEAKERVWILHLIFTNCQDFMANLRHAARSGCKDIRIMMVQPFSSASRLRYTDHQPRPHSPDLVIIDNLLNIFNDPELKDIVKVRLYSSLPSVCLFITDEHITFRPYLNANPISETFQTEYTLEQNEAYQQLIAHFNLTWEKAIPVDEVEVNTLAHNHEGIKGMFPDRVEAESALMKSVLTQFKVRGDAKFGREDGHHYFKAYYQDKNRTLNFLMDYFPPKNLVRLIWTTSKRFFIGSVLKHPQTPNLHMVQLDAMDHFGSAGSPTTLFLHTKNLKNDTVIAGLYSQVNFEGFVVSGKILLFKLTDEEVGTLQGSPLAHNPDLLDGPIPDEVSIFLEKQWLGIPNEIISNQEGLERYLEDKHTSWRTWFNVRRHLAGKYLVVGLSNSSDEEPQVIYLPMRIDENGFVYINGREYEGRVMVHHKNLLMIPFSSRDQSIERMEGVFLASKKSRKSSLYKGTHTSITSSRKIAAGRIIIFSESDIDLEDKDFEATNIIDLDSPIFKKMEAAYPNLINFFLGEEDDFLPAFCHCDLIPPTPVHP